MDAEKEPEELISLACPGRHWNRDHVWLRLAVNKRVADCAVLD